MKILFNETFEDKITIWVDTEFVDLDELKKGCVNIVDVVAGEDLILDTYFVFYTKMIFEDAVEDKVRSTVYIRCLKDAFDVTINVSDYQFVCNYQQLKDIKANIEMLMSSKLYDK